jgi:hypothetical protein
MHNTFASIKIKNNSVSRFGMHWSMPYSKKKLESVMLDEVVPQDPLQQLSSLADNLQHQRFLHAMTCHFINIKDSIKILI